MIILTLFLFLPSLRAQLEAVKSYFTAKNVPAEQIESVLNSFDPNGSFDIFTERIRTYPHFEDASNDPDYSLLRRVDKDLTLFKKYKRNVRRETLRRL